MQYEVHPCLSGLVIQTVEHAPPSFGKRIGAIFKIKDIRPCQLNLSGQYFGLDKQFSLRLNPYSNLTLIVMRTIKAAIIQIYSHGKTIT
jgi:hypothetical protein